MENLKDLNPQIADIINAVKTTPRDTSSSPSASFCEQCRVLEAVTMTVEALLASKQDLGAQSSMKSTVSLGVRSGFESRAGTCLGCCSILDAFDHHLKEESNLRGTKGGLREDYDLSLVVDLKNVEAAYSSPLAITTPGVESMFLRPTVKYPPREALGRSCNPEKLDLTLIKKWITCCEESHQDICEEGVIEGMSSPASPVTYIDLRDSCLVSFTEPPKYVALSYVWGRVPTLMTVLNNRKKLSRPGALLREVEQIPRTIRDAMALVGELGIRYLWVDALCIVQDDPSTKQDHLSHMPSIYSFAYFTLAIVDGPHANSGIPGTGTESISRSVPPEIKLPSKSIPIITSHYNRMKFLQRMGIGYKPVWTTRAWTMQEQLFSRRILLIQGLASWMCLRTQWLEELERPSESLEWAKREKPDQRYRLGNPDKLQMTALGQLVVEYNERDLSFEEDVADAFVGVAELHKHIFGPFLFGMPEVLFDLAMCWQPSAGLRSGLRRRKSTKPGRNIPSWSWMGWFGKLDLVLWEVFQDHILELFGNLSRTPFLGFDFHIKPLTTFYKLCLNCRCKFTISNAYHKCREVKEIPVSYKRIDAPQNWNEQPRYYYERTAERVKIPYRYPITDTDEIHSCTDSVFDTKLTFRTQRLFLSIAVRDNCKREHNIDKKRLEAGGRFNSVVDAQILDEPGKRIGSVTLVDVGDGTEYQSCEFIAISEGECPSRQGDGTRWGKHWTMGREHPFREDVDDEIEADFRFVNVLWIEWVEEVAFRRALGRIRKEDWEKGLAELSAGEREIDVILG